MWVSGTCASDADCCNGIKCVIDPLYLSQTGFCCNTAGGACETDGDCCGGDCVNGSCACLPPTDFNSPSPPMCQLSTDCCDGVCTQEHLAGGGYCVAESGQKCDQPYQCSSDNCRGKECGSCSVSQGDCTTAADCCAGLICGTSLNDWTGEESATPEVITGCCAPNGNDCVPDDPDAGICCGVCLDGGVCTCIAIGDYCRTDQGCCSGAACMLGGRGYPEALACCQMDGQVCFSPGDCCSGSCVNEQCECQPAGTPCSPQPGLFAQAGAHACCSGQCSAGGVCL